MGGPVVDHEARGMRGPLREVLRAPRITARTRRAITRGASLAWLALLVSVALAGCSACDGQPAPSDEPPVQSTEQTATPQETAPPAVDNPLPVGQAVDAIAGPAITQVLGAPVLTRASEAEALIVNLVYQAPAAAVEGDGERLLNEFVSRGATVDPEQAGVDYHNDAEEFMVLYDTGDPSFQTIRVTVTPGSADVYVNADKAQ